MVGGGAVYLDYDQIFWHLLLPSYNGTVEGLYHDILKAPVSAYRKMGVAATHRPVNDIVVGPRKIGGTGAAQLAQSTVIVGSILMDFDTVAMSRVLRVPSEKFRDKMVQSLDEYMTTVRRELGSAAPSREEATHLLVQEFATALGQDIYNGSLSDEEWDLVEAYAQKLFDPEFVYHGERGLVQAGVKIRGDVHLYEGICKAPGGLIRMVFRTRQDVFDDVALTGDFFITPMDISKIERFQQELIGQPVDDALVARAANELLNSLVILGVSAEHIRQAFLNAQALEMSALSS
jgi:lipoate-protein ligase A